MLVITKKYGEMIKVGEAFIRVERHKNGSNQVSFYIQAPIEVKVDKLSKLEAFTREAEKKSMVSTLETNNGMKGVIDGTKF